MVTFLQNFHVSLKMLCVLKTCFLIVKQFATDYFKAYSAGKLTYDQHEFNFKFTSPHHVTVLYESLLTQEPHAVKEYIKLSLKFF